MELFCSAIRRHSVSPASFFSFSAMCNFSCVSYRLLVTWSVHKAVFSFYICFLVLFVATSVALFHYITNGLQDNSANHYTLDIHYWLMISQMTCLNDRLFTNVFFEWSDMISLNLAFQRKSITKGWDLSLSAECLWIKKSELACSCISGHLFKISMFFCQYMCNLEKDIYP